MDRIEQKVWWQRIYDYPKTVFAVLVLLFLWPITFGTYALQYDAMDVYLPWRFFGSESLRLGEVPMWNPYQDGGYPFYADHQYSIWNPELFISSLFGRFSPRMQQFWFLFYFWIGGVGFLFLGKQLNLTEKSKFWGGIIFMFSGVLIGHGQSVISILGGVWLPWAIGGYLFFLKNPFSIKEILTLSICLFIMLTCGYQAVSIMLFYVLLAFFIAEIIRILKSKEYRKLQPILLGHASVIGILTILMAGTFYSIYDVSPYLKRLGGLPIEDTDRFLFHPKTFESLLLPISSLKKEWDGSTISTQSIFLGITSIFLFILGLTQWKKLNLRIKILGVFGLIYGLTSFGSNTPIQPFLAKFIPGFDQFYYASFFRFFLWISLIILVCIGIENIKKFKSTSKLWIGFSILIVGILSVVLIVFGESISSIDWSKNYIKLLRTINSKEAAFINGIVQIVIFGAGIILFIWKRKLELTILIVLFAELFVSVQLMLPITVHENAKTDTLTNYLEQFPEGFPICDNDIAIDETIPHSYASFWRNKGNFSNTPSLDGWTSFHLASRDSVYDFHPKLREELGSKPLFYVKNGTPKIKITKSEPTYFKLNIQSTEKDTLVFQQANYPGWTAQVNGETTKIFTENIFEMGLVIPKGKLEVEFKFDKPLVPILFYISMFGFLFIGSVLWIIYSKNKKVSISLVVILFGFVFFQLWSFSKSTSSKKYALNDQLILTEKGLTSAWRELSSESFTLKSGSNNFSSEFISRIALQSSSFQINETQGEIVLSGKKQEHKRIPLKLDSTQMYLNLDEIMSELNKNETKRIFVTARSKEIQDFDQIELVLVKKKGNEDVIHFSSHLGNFKKENNEFIHYSTLTIPKLGLNESIGVFLYNINSKTRNFSDFQVKLETNSRN